MAPAEPANDGLRPAEALDSTDRPLWGPAPVAGLPLTRPRMTRRLLVVAEGGHDTGARRGDSSWCEAVVTRT
ncbi:MAG: hypothetical protein WCD11_16610 [Solirubrobacteraceae bacterium]